MLQPKDKDWLNGYKNKTHIYVVYKRPTSDLGTHTDWKWRGRKIFHAYGNQKKAGVAILLSDKIDFKIKTGASLVAQWLRVCLPMQGTRVRALVWEDPTCRGATGPMGHNCWACASGACAPRQERPRWWEARAPRWRVAPACRNWRKPSRRSEDPTQT